MALVEVHELAFSYDGKQEVFSNVEFALAEGESLLLVGDNGSGKSTLGRLLAGLIRPTKGAIIVAGSTPSDLAARKRCHLVSYMDQVSHLSLLRSTIASELVSFARTAQPSALEDAYKEWATRHALPMDTEINPRDLTTPELWRLVLGLYAVILGPTLLIVDEVFCPGSKQQQDCARDVIDRRKRQGKATIFLYQRRLTLPFDLNGTLSNNGIAFSAP